MPTERHGFGAAVLGERIFAIGGCCSQMNEVEEYNPTTDTWETRAPMRTSRYYHTVVALNDKIYAIGGYQDWNVFLSTVEVYTPPFLVNELSISYPYYILVIGSLGAFSVLGWRRKWKN